MTEFRSTPVLNSSYRQPVAAASPRIRIAAAGQSDREIIYRLRNEIYAHELGQHVPNPAGKLRDALDESNHYIVAKLGEDICGFISITPPSASAYSVDKYFKRESWLMTAYDRLYEVRLLSVLKPHRGRELAMLLMYAALRWVEAHDGKHIVAIGRREIVDLYLRVGLKPLGLSVQSGAVTYDLLHAGVAELRQHAKIFFGALERLREKTDWQLSFPFWKPAACFHGGAFFAAIGEKFEALERNRTVINADVLDAWFPPAPKVLADLSEHLPWLLRTSPPTACEGLVDTIAQTRGVATGNILPGAGSSDLIFRALNHWLTPKSHTLILDPTYGEYAHVLEQVIGCTVDRLPLSSADDYAVDLDRLEAALADDYDLLVLVNPNSPTGRHVARASLQEVLRRAPLRTRVWIDETYVEYAGEGQSIEKFAAETENVIICKSMSKVYALSGARVAYLCAGPHQLEGLRAITPPWIVSLPAQIAAVRALQDPDYYSERYRETHALSSELANELRKFGWRLVPGIANFLLCRLAPTDADGAIIVKECRRYGLYIRDASLMGSQLGQRTVRIAVKDAGTNRRMVEVLKEVVTRSRETRI